MHYLYIGQPWILDRCRTSNRAKRCVCYIDNTNNVNENKKPAQLTSVSYTVNFFHPTSLYLKHSFHSRRFFSFFAQHNTDGKFKSTFYLQLRLLWLLKYYVQLWSNIVIKWFLEIFNHFTLCNKLRKVYTVLYTGEFQTKQNNSRCL